MTPTKFQVIIFSNVEKTHTPQIRGLQVEVSLCPFQFLLSWFLDYLGQIWAEIGGNQASSLLDFMIIGCPRLGFKAIGFDSWKIDFVTLT